MILCGFKINHIVVSIFKSSSLMLDSPICSITDQLDGLEVCFSWWFHCPNLTLWIKDSNALIIYMT